MNLSRFVTEERLDMLFHFLETVASDILEADQLARDPELKMDIQMLQSDMEAIQYEIERTVADEKSDDGKLKYTNAAKRNTESAYRLLNHSEYQSLKNDLEVKKAQQNDFWRKKEQLKTQYEGYIAMMDAVTAMIKLDAIQKEVELWEKKKQH